MIELNQKFDVEIFHTQLSGGKRLLQNKKLENLKRFY